MIPQHHTSHIFLTLHFLHICTRFDKNITWKLSHCELPFRALSRLTEARGCKELFCILTSPLFIISLYIYLYLLIYLFI